MKAIPPQITVKTMSDAHLESFLRCPYKFYYQYIFRGNSEQVRWKQVVQSTINQVVRHFYQLPTTEQHKISILKLVDCYWKDVSPKLFDSKEHYYLLLAKTTDHLLQHLSEKELNNPLLFLYKKLNMYVEELETNLSLTFEIVNWGRQSFKVKKFLVEADEEMVNLYLHLVVVFSQKAFNKLPENIEIITLLDGKKYHFTPTSESFTQGIMYLNYMKEILQRPEVFQKTKSLTECQSCPFTNKCTGMEDDFSKDSKKKYDKFLH